MITKLENDWVSLEADKLKRNIKELQESTEKMVTLEQIERMSTDVKNIRILIADNGYEV